MSNLLQDHPWLNYVAVSVCTTLVHSVIGRVRRVFASPDREDFKALETRLSAQIGALSARTEETLKELGGRIEELGDKVYARIDEKTDGLGIRLDTRIDTFVAAARKVV